MMRFVTLDEARLTRGLRLVVLEGVPSPWSETAKGCFDIKGIDYVAVKLTPRDTETRAWTGHQNAPVALYNDEPPRADWKEIVMLAEAIAPTPRLVPVVAADRDDVWHLGDEILGPGGLTWCLRLHFIHEGIVSDGVRGFPVRAAHYLATRYGYTPEQMGRARARILTVLDALARRMSDGRPYFLGAVPSAVDIFAASALGVMVPLDEASCPMLPAFRRAYETLDPELRAAIAPSLVAHRDFMYAHHLTLPIRC